MLVCWQHCIASQTTSPGPRLVATLAAFQRGQEGCGHCMRASDKAVSKVDAKCSPEALLKSLHTSFCSLQTPPSIVINQKILMLMRHASTNAAVGGQPPKSQDQDLCSAVHPGLQGLSQKQRPLM